MSYPLNDGPNVVYYTLFFRFSQLVIDRWGEPDGCQHLLGGVFHFDEVVGLEDFFQSAAAEVGNREDALSLEAGFGENIFYVFRMIVIETVFADFFVVGDFFVERINFAATGDVASHFGKSAFVGNFYDGNATGL